MVSYVVDVFSEYVHSISSVSLENPDFYKANLIIWNLKM